MKGTCFFHKPQLLRSTCQIFQNKFQVFLKTNQTTFYETSLFEFFIYLFSLQAKETSWIATYTHSTMPGGVHGRHSLMQSDTT